LKNKYDVNLEGKELFRKNNDNNKNKKMVDLFKITENKKKEI
jgi:hypothetical protein